MAVFHPCQDISPQFTDKLKQLHNIAYACGTDPVIFNRVAFGPAHIKIVGIRSAFRAKYQGQSLNGAIML